MVKGVPYSEEDGLKKGPWTAEEDQKLIDYIRKHGHGRWRTLPLNAGLNRCGKSCRLRWTNYLRPDIKRGGFLFEEEETIIHLHSILGNKWSTIAAYLPGRTDNEIKNYWNTHIKRRLLRMGINPMTHGPRLINLPELYSFLKSPRQLNIQNLLQIDSKMNRDFLNQLVTFLALPQWKNPPNSQQILHNNQLANPQLIQNQIETLQSNNLHNSTTSNAPSLNDTLLMQAEMGQFSQSLMTNSGSKNSPPISCYNNGDNSTYSEQNLVSPPELSHYAGYGSVISTPSSSSSHLNSSTMHVNGSAEDDKDAYCGNMTFSDIPYSFGF